MNKILNTLYIFILLTTSLNAQDYYVVKWTASWCGPCKSWDKNERAKTEKFAKVVNIDIDKYPDLAKKYNISSVPQFWMCGTEDKMVYKKYTGYTTSTAIKQSIEDLKDKNND